MSESNGTSLRTAVELLAHTSLRDCYQCGKCSAGCPMAGRMDVLPNRLVRLVQIGEVDRAMRSEAIWQCVSCLTCSTRCPKSVDCAGIIDALRQLSAERDQVAPGQRRTLLFQKAFLDNIRRNGRLGELELVGRFKTKAFLEDLNVPLLLKDAMLAPRMIKRRKFHFRPDKVKDRGVVRRIFERCRVSCECARKTPTAHRLLERSITKPPTPHPRPLSRKGRGE